MSCIINFEFKRPKECENNISSFHDSMYLYNEKTKISGAMHFLLGCIFNIIKNIQTKSQLHMICMKYLKHMV